VEAAAEARGVKDRVRVLHVIQNLNYGGMERLFADIVRRLDPARFESHVLVLGYFGRFAEGLDQFATLHQAVSMSRFSMLVPRSLARQIRGIAPDVVHTHSGVWYKTSLAARMAGRSRLIHTEHGRQRPDPWTERKIGWLASRRTDCVVAVSEILERQLRETVVAPGTAVRLIRNGVDTDQERPRPDSGSLRAELGLAGGTPVIGSIGRLEAIKGYDIMVEAFALLRRGWSGPEPPVLVVGGDGTERQELQRRVDELGLDHSIKLLGWRDDIPDLRSAFTLFTMSSRSEGTSVSLLEAMSSGLCPVVTDVGGNADVLGNSLRHRLVIPESPSALAEAWIAALADRGGLARDGVLSRARIQEKFSLDQMVRAYGELYVS